ncbi:WD40 repeat-like protein [Wallemia mellicola]|nr:WD40 repeat-like protein [Wallemia mellicola]
MPRVPHKSHPIGFPIYSMAFISPQRIVLGGGGGSSSKTGVKNKLVTYDITSEDISTHSTYELQSGEDCPMSISVPFTNKKYLLAGINSSQKPNNNCRLFQITQDKLEQIVAKQTIEGDNIEDYQRIAEISPSSQVVVVDGKTSEKKTSLHAFSYPEMETLFDKAIIVDGDILSVSFSNDGALLAVTTSKSVLIYSFVYDEKKNKVTTKVLQTISDPLVQKTSGASFRFAKFGKGIHVGRLYTVTNSGPPQKKKGARPGFLTVWDTNTWKVIRTVTLADKPVTACDLSEDGQLIAFASADLSVGIVSAKTLAPLVRILSAHSFPVTCLSFDPTATVLASGSPDNSLRLVQVPQDLAASGKCTIDMNKTFLKTLIDSARAFVQALVIAILIGLLAVLLQLYQTK